LHVEKLIAGLYYPPASEVPLRLNFFLCLPYYSMAVFGLFFVAFSEISCAYFVAASTLHGASPRLAAHHFIATRSHLAEDCYVVHSLSI
jgi:hypothetical protein